MSHVLDLKNEAVGHLNLHACHSHATFVIAVALGLTVAIFSKLFAYI